MKKLIQKHQHTIAATVFSVVILFFLGFQFYTAIHWREFWPKFRRLQAPYKLLKPPKDPSLWPFMSYPMYSYPKYTGNKIKQYAIFGTLVDKSEVRILPKDLGLNYWIFMYGFKEAIRLENSQDIINFVHLYETKNDKKISIVKLKIYPLEITKDGLIERPIEVIKEFKIQDLQENK